MAKIHEDQTTYLVNETVIDINNNLNHQCYYQMEGIKCKYKSDVNQIKIDSINQNHNRDKSHIDYYNSTDSIDSLKRINKLSMAEENAQELASPSFRYRLAFYFPIIILGSIFLYLIYSNLFSDSVN